MKYRSLFFAATLGLSACSKQPDPGPVTAQERPEIGIQVENQFAASLTIYLEAGTFSRRLGQVNIAQTISFVVPWTHVPSGVMRLRAEVIGSSERVLTDQLRVDAGQIVKWTLAPQLRMSSIVLY
jgi:hypothetical protein